MKDKHEEFIYPLDLLNSVYDEVINSKTACKVQLKVSAAFHSNHFSFYSNRDELEFSC